MIFILLILAMSPILISGWIFAKKRKKSKEDHKKDSCLSFYLYDWGDFMDDHIVLSALNVISFGITFVCICFLGCIATNVIEGMAIEEKIQVVQEQNSEIESKVKIAVENYQGYEKGTFESLKPEDIIIAATMYPELQSNQIVQEQVKIYQDNNNKLVSLREERANLRAYRFMLYFGN